MPDGCRHDGTAHHVADRPKSGDAAALLTGDAVTLCCGSFVSLHDDATPFCKCCFRRPPRSEFGLLGRRCAGL
jgi:hypothetical protein